MTDFSVRVEYAAFPLSTAKMIPTTNPPPQIMLGIEQTATNMPHALLADLVHNIRAPRNTRTLHVTPTAESVYRTIASLPAEPGSVGINQGSHSAEMPTSAELHRIKIPAKRDRLNALLDFPFEFELFV
ncbi:MAG: hypothetical protein NWE95_02215 [Candidatus Bathyarchaeota archaeon]|nr:hypothetical protein [Candidatus Bathyarchaeota archaeon]